MHETRILAFMGRYVDAVNRGLEIFPLIGITLPPFRTDPAIAAAYEAQLLDEINEATEELGLVQSFKALPVLRDPVLLSVHTILVEMSASLAFTVPDLLRIIPLLGVRVFSGE
jgi:hypothetical protein